MRRSATFLLLLSLTLTALLTLLTLPVAAQDAATIEPGASSAPAAASPPSPAASSGPEASAATVPPTPALPTVIPAADGPVVQGVFFFSPTCGHCHYVITEILPGIYEANGGEWVVSFDESVLPAEPAFYLMSNGRLQLLMVDVSQADGEAMYLADAEALGFEETPGVPLLHIGDEWYLGSGDIPENLPGIVENGLAGEGIAWPPAPGIDAVIAPFRADGSVAGPEPAADDEEDEAVLLPTGPDESPLDKIGRDPVGNGISIVVLIALVVSLVAAPLLAVRGALPAVPSWLAMVLVLLGIGVAAYLASIETTGSAAVCGPVGDCNAVQQSEYARLLGIPIGVLGVVGYLLIGGLWIVSRVTRGAAADWALVLMAAAAFGGTLFSAYLTFLEPFVIGATCMWCITSAIVMLALLWVTAGPGWKAWLRSRGDRDRMVPARP
jgi:uncharacterized membrane protein